MTIEGFDPRQTYVVVLTEFGEALKVRGWEVGKELAFPRHGEQVMSIGIHAVCEGVISLRRASSTHAVLLCPTCQLRLPVTSRLRSVGDLLIHLETVARERGWQPPIDAENLPVPV
ncbi:MAG: hypothetical protein HYY50_05060 [Candidatus Kerfeldbacteria bacterium]|nr:hypothetical protein [Candidatus Kerfeldbacteria bacterium]